MPTRREFLTAAAGLGASSLVSPARTYGAIEAETPDKTWLTYAVNVEMIWSKLPFLERVKKVAEAGFSHYEFWQWRPKDIEAIARLNKELGLEVSQFSASPKRFSEGITDPARLDEFLEDVKAAAAVAKKLGVKKLCVVAGEETAGLGRDEQTRAVITALKAGAQVVAPEGITLILEPLNVLVDHPKQLIVTSAQGAQVIRDVGSPNIRMLFDVYHQQITEGNLSRNIRTYADLIGYFQIADNPGRHEPGTGEIQYAQVLRTIHDAGYRGAIGLELSPKADPMAALQAVRKADLEARDWKV